jgi:hypothetical protein
MEEARLFFLIAAAFVVFFTTLWCSIVFILSLAGGWRALGKRYAAKDMEVAGQRWEMQRGAMRVVVGYNHILTIVANTRGIYLSVMALFRIGHPPLFIPWEHIEIRESPGIWGPRVQFTFTQVPGTNLTVSRKLGAEIAAAGQRTIVSPVSSRA